jgi:hypothetical protein
MITMPTFLRTQDDTRLKYSGGTGRAYIPARLDRDGHTQLAADVRAMPSRGRSFQRQPERDAARQSSWRSLIRGKAASPCFSMKGIEFATACDCRAADQKLVLGVPVSIPRGAEGR